MSEKVSAKNVKGLWNPLHFSVMKGFNINHCENIIALFTFIDLYSAVVFFFIPN